MITGITEARAIFLRDLRDPNAEQAQGTLRRGDGMCCLGMGCEAFRRETGQGEWGTMRPITKDREFMINGREHGIFMPPEVAEWLDLETSNPILVVIPPEAEYQGTNEGVTASGLNDGFRLGFVTLAFFFEYLFRTGRPYVLTAEQWEELRTRSNDGETDTDV